MTHTYRPLRVALVLTLGAVAVQADSTADARHAIQAAYDASNAAAARKDAAGTLAHFTPDAVTVDTQGRKTTIAQQRLVATRLFAAARAVTARTKITQFTLGHGNQATATVQEHVALALVNPQTQQPAQFVVDDTARDLWVKTAQGWRQKSSKDLTYHATLNGQALPAH